MENIRNIVYESTLNGLFDDLNKGTGIIIDKIKKKLQRNAGKKEEDSWHRWLDWFRTNKNYILDNLNPDLFSAYWI